MGDGFWDKAWSKLSAEWQVIKQAWQVFAIAQIVAIVAIWAVLNWHYSGMVETDDTTIQSQSAMIESLKDTLDGEGPGPVQRHLTNNQTACISSNLKNQTKNFIGAPTIAIFSVPTEEAQIYANDFYTTFQSIGFQMFFFPDALPTHDSDVGIVFGLADPSNPSKNALRVETALLSCGISMTDQKSGVSKVVPDLDFDIFIVNRP